MGAPDRLIGRVTRCSIRGFVGGIRLPEPDVPVFGSFCRADAQRGQSQVVGLIYDISIEDDELARQMAAADSPPAEWRADNQLNRPLPIEIRALAVGYRQGEAMVHGLPPQPPLTLADIHPLTDAEVRAFTEQLDFLPLVLSAGEIPVDDLVAAALRQAAQARPAGERRAFLVRAGRACAHWMADDLPRLSSVLRMLGA
jgi:hypothetical protein